MTINDILQQWQAKLLSSGVSTARLDVLVLLEDATKKDRSWLLAHPEFIVPKTLLEQLEEQLERRNQHVPLAYLRGKSEFYGRKFIINEHVLVPRPESEAMIDLLKLLHDELTPPELQRLRVLDVGTGSGALAITAKLELPQAEVFATDIDPSCLAIAQANAQALSADIKFMQGNLLEPFINSDSYLKELDNFTSVLLCNLPYVPDGHNINQAAMKEPRLAIFGGKDGLDYYRALFEGTHNFNSRPQYIITEALPFQHTDLATISKSAGYILDKAQDYIQQFKSAR